MDLTNALPVIGTLLIGVGVVVPLRDGRRGRRATVSGTGPLRAHFSLVPAPAAAAASPSHATSDRSLAFAEATEPGVDADEVPSRSPAASFVPLVPTVASEAPPSAVGMRFARTSSPEARDAERPSDGLRLFPRATLPEEETARRSADGAELLAPTLTPTPVFASLRRLFRREPAETPREAEPARSQPEPPSDDGPTSFAETLATVENGRIVPELSRPSDGSATLEPATPEEPVRISPIVITPSVEPPRSRAVPLTRLPLRTVVDRVCWPEALVPARRDLTPEVRQRLLEREIATSEGALPVDALRAACREERGAARTLAVRLLGRAAAPEARAELGEALARGTDEERAVAIEALVACGLSADVERALGDPVDAIAARASLATCRSRRLADHRAHLAAHLDGPRLDAVLGLLCGILE